MNPNPLTQNTNVGQSFAPLKTTLFLLALACATPVFARIGETAEQLNKRYGKPLEIIRETLETRRYLFPGFTIVVGLENGVSQCEVYRKQDDSRMTEGEIHGLLQANSGGL